MKTFDQPMLFFKQQINQKIDQIINQIKQADIKQKVLVLFGDSKCGKTTTFNYLIEKKLQLQYDKELGYQVIKGDFIKQTEQIETSTIISNIISIDDLTLIELSSFDQLAQNEKIINLILLYCLSSLVKSIHLLAVIPDNYIEDPQMEAFIQSCTIFNSHFTNRPECISIILTKVESQDNKKQFWNNLIDLRDQYKLFQNIRTEDVYIFLNANPVQSEGKRIRQDISNKHFYQVEDLKNLISLQSQHSSEALKFYELQVAEKIKSTLGGADVRQIEQIVQELKHSKIIFNKKFQECLKKSEKQRSNHQKSTKNYFSTFLEQRDRKFFQIKSNIRNSQTNSATFMILLRYFNLKDDLGLNLEKIIKIVSILQKFSFYEEAILFSMSINNLSQIQKLIVQSIKINAIYCQFIEMVLLPYLFKVSPTKNTIVKLFDHLSANTYKKSKKKQLEQKMKTSLSKFIPKNILARNLQIKPIYIQKIIEERDKLIEKIVLLEDRVKKSMAFYMSQQILSIFIKEN